MTNHRIPLAAASMMVTLLCACDKMQQQGPPPSFQSPTVDVARSITGSEAGAPASAASGAGSK
jgi:hypothetical protein